MRFFQLTQSSSDCLILGADGCQSIWTGGLIEIDPTVLQKTGVNQKLQSRITTIPMT